MTPGDCLGNVLHIDLTTRDIEVEPLDERIVRDFIGGFGVSSRLAYDLIRPPTDPLSPQNTIIFAGGILGGTLAPASSKVMATTKLPYTDAIGTAFGGGCGDALKQAGYGHVIVKGRAEKPVFLKIFDDEVELCDAAHLWGMDIRETTEALRQRFGSDCSVIAIGPAGEKLLRISFALVNNLSHLGEGGLGAVMGHKNLKAIVVRGTKGVKVADRRAFMRIVDNLHRSLMKVSYRDDWIKIGTAIAAWGRSDRRGSLRPVLEADPYGPLAYDAIWTGTLACPTCPVGCKFLLDVGDGEGGSLLAPITNPGGGGWRAFNVGGIKEAMRLRDWCNRQGVDERGATAVMEFAVSLFEDGLLTTGDTNGMVLKRDYATVSKLLHMMLRREGFGRLLADGLASAVLNIGKGAERYEGMREEASYFDPRRSFQTRTITAVTSPKRLSSIASLGPSFTPGHPVEDFERYLKRTLGLSDDVVGRICTASNANMARMAKHAEDFYCVQSSLGVCIRQPVAQCYNIDIAAGLYQAATGFETNPAQLRRAGERVWNIWKVSNIREGFTREDDKFPEKFFAPLVVGERTYVLADYYGNPLDRVAMKKLLDDYYEERGWDLETSIPTKRKLLELGLGFVAADIERS